MNSGRKDKDKDNYEGKGRGKQNFKNKDTKRKGEKSSDEDIPTANMITPGSISVEGEIQDNVFLETERTNPLQPSIVVRTCLEGTNFVEKDALTDLGNCYLCGKSLKRPYPLEYLRDNSIYMLDGRDNEPDLEMRLNGWQHWRASAVMQLGCNHYFHYGCLDNYFKRNRYTPRGRPIRRVWINTGERSLFSDESDLINCPKCIDDGEDNRCVTTNIELTVDTFIGNEAPQSSLLFPDHVNNVIVNASERYQTPEYIGEQFDNIDRDNNGCLPGGSCVISGGKGKKTKKKGKKTKKKGKKTKKKGKKTKKKGKNKLKKRK